MREAIAAEIDQAAASQIDHERNPSRMTELREIGLGHAGCEAHDGVIARVHFHHQTRLGADGRGVVVQMHAIGRPDFAKAAAGARHDVRHPE